MKKRLILSFILALTMIFSSLAFIACDKEEVIVYTVTSEEWDEAFDLGWKNVTYEFTVSDPTDPDGNTMKIKLLEDGGMHQTGNMWGERYVIYRKDAEKWQAYNADGELQFEYTTRQAYIDGSYGDDFGFIDGMLPNGVGVFKDATFDEENNQYTIKNLSISMGDEEYSFDLVAKFENAKLVYLKIESTGEYAGMVLEATFTDYGTTTIDYPEAILNA